MYKKTILRFAPTESLPLNKGAGRTISKADIGIIHSKYKIDRGICAFKNSLQQTLVSMIVTMGVTFSEVMFSRTTCKQTWKLGIRH